MSIAGKSAASSSSVVAKYNAFQPLAARYPSDVSAPLDFLKIFAGQLRQAGIPFAITSGMACVHYGLQQTTKDSDWIIPAEDLERLRALFTRLEGDLPPWRISYRQICGAPLEAEFMALGWTSHLSVWDSAGSVEHKVDIFSKPPRVQSDELVADAEGWASEHVVAQMKKTDRDKDWPIVTKLGEQLWAARRAEGLLHIADFDALLAAWRAASPKMREDVIKRRPLLRALVSKPEPERLRIQRMFVVERMVWERVNLQRHSRYTRAWRQFYRSWRKEFGWDWPTSERFAQQHERLMAGIRAHALPANPMEGLSTEALVQAAVQEVCILAGASHEEVAQVLPPVYVLLP
jgi:hypothetical protein